VQNVNSVHALRSHGRAPPMMSARGGSIGVGVGVGGPRDLDQRGRGRGNLTSVSCLHQVPSVRVF